jgi:hypothetical protein
MRRIQLEAVGIEFEEEGNTIWVQSAQGTSLRIKCSGQIKVKHCEAPEVHADMIVAGDIEVCVPVGARAPATGGDVRRPGRVSTGSGVVQAVGRRAGAVPAAQTAVRGAGRSPVSGGSGQTVGRRAVRGVR